MTALCDRLVDLLDRWDRDNWQRPKPIPDTPEITKAREIVNRELA